MNNYEPLNIKWQGTEYKVLFPEDLLKILRIQKREGEKLALTFIDADRVKQLNEENNDKNRNI